MRKPPPNRLLLDFLERGHPHHGSVEGVERCVTCMGQFHGAQQMLQGFDAKTPPAWVPKVTGGALVDAIRSGR